MNCILLSYTEKRDVFMSYLALVSDKFPYELCKGFQHFLIAQLVK